MRVWVPLRTRKMLGYVVKLTRRTKIKNIKAILEVIDELPALDKNILSLTQELSNYYGCSWGEAIETALPEGLRKGRLFTPKPYISTEKQDFSKISNHETLLIYDLNRTDRLDVYIREIKNTLANHKSVIILLPDIDLVVKTKEIIQSKIGLSAGILYRQQKQELKQWSDVKNGKFNIIIGTRSAIFAPLDNLGLIIIDEEQDSVYKQDQVPHYHVRDVAFMRINIDKAKLILGSTSPSLESFYLAKRGKIRYVLLSSVRDFPQIKIIDMASEQYKFKQRNIILSRYLEESIIQTLNVKGKILLFLNRRGFATFASCRYCGIVLKCPRCNINLVYHFKDNMLNCHYCNFKMAPVQICPNCNSGYIRYAGMGTEKIESELSRIFPQARIKRLDNSREVDIQDGDIFISTESILKGRDYNFDLIGVLSIDNSLNRIDFRATERTFALLVGLIGLTDKKILIQTKLPHHYCLKATELKNINMFYDEELKRRKQLDFPPYQHLCLVKLRGKKENRVKEVCNALFNRLNKYSKNNKAIKIVSVNPSQPAKLRGNFYWQILIKAHSPIKIIKFLKLHLKSLSHSGIIVTIDMDPL